MAMRWMARIIIAVMLAGIFLLPRRARACGPFFPRAVIVYKVHPDFPLTEFARGHIGVLQPSYARSYLFVAYRYLTGDPLDSEQQKVLDKLWDDRLGHPLSPGLNNDEIDSTWAKVTTAWKDARAKVTSSAGPDICEDRSLPGTDSYSDYPNYLDDSVRTAAATLQDRIKQFGATSPEVQDWVSAQDAVFSNCSKDKVAIPSLAKSSFPAAIQADRAYQIAAANFYAAKFDDAAKMFSDIAADPKSPWCGIAPYLAARCLVRKATVDSPQGKTDLATLGQAEARLNGVLADKRLQSIHPAAQRLLNLVRFRLHPDDRLAELAHAVMDKAGAPGFKQDVDDFTLLMDGYEKKSYGSIPDAAKKIELTDWIFTIQATDPAALNHSLKKWADTHSTAWLVNALSKVEAGNPSVPGLTATAAKISADSPAYPEAIFQAARLMMQSGKAADARTLLDTALAHRTSLPPSAVNELLSERMYLATTLEEFLKYAVRNASGVTVDADGEELPEDPSSDEGVKKLLKETFLDTDSVGIINERLPLALMAKAATTSALAPRLRNDIALATWTRAAILENEAVGKEMATVVESDLPALKPLIAPYLSAASEDERAFAAVFLMLKTPGARPYVASGVGRTTPLGEIDDYRDNWWCAYNAATWGDLPNFYVVTDLTPPPTQKAQEVKSPRFLTPLEKQASELEWKRLVSIATGPNYLASQVMNWAQKKPDDPRLAEALYLVVRSTRYGCKDKETGKYSKAAFDLLHKRFPDSSWAKMTKYWYAN
ncbi:MAG TPA: hypothetical protein VI756_11005 [Blastocatellia bacterium]